MTRSGVTNSIVERRGPALEHVGLGHAHVTFDLPVVAPRAEHQQHRLQRHQTRGDHDADAHPPQNPLRTRLARIAIETRNQMRHNAWTLHGAARSAHSAALIDACNARSDDRSAFTSSTRIPSNGSSSASASSSTSIWRLSTW